MRHEYKVQMMKEGYIAMSKRLDSQPISLRNGNFDRKKLESAYDKISSEYEWVLRRKPKQKVMNYSTLKSRA